MQEKTEFAEGFEREGNIIRFPRDVTWRRQLFPQEVFSHPAKANMYLIQELVRYLTKEGDSIIDPFAGTGTLMLACLEGRHVHLIDIEEAYRKIINDAWGKISDQTECTGAMFLHAGDCRQRLLDFQFQADAAIFSPPYASALSHSTAIEEQKEVLAQYGLDKASPQNLARLNTFYFAQSMLLVYQRLHDKLKPGAPMAVISKDIMKGPERQLISSDITRQANRGGFELAEWHKWKPPGSMQQSIMRSKGAHVVEDEDIIIFRRK